MPFKISQAPKPEQIWHEGLDTPDTPEKERTYVTFRQATGEDQVRVSAIVNGSSFVYELDNGTRVVEQTTPVNYLDTGAKVWSTLVSCNIQNADGKPLFTEKMTWETFQRGWSAIGHEARRETRNAMVMVNPHWGFPTIGGAL